MSSTNQNPITRAPGEVIIDNFVQRNRANNFLIMAFLEEQNNAQLDFTNFLKSKPSPEVMISCIAKLEAAKNSTNGQINAASVQNSINTPNHHHHHHHRQPQLTTTSKPNSVTSKQVRIVRRKCIPMDKKFRIIKLKCTEKNCNSEFKSMSELEVHLASRRHAILCHRCPQNGCTFSARTMSQLVNHKKKEHPFVSFQCKICMRNFHQISFCKDRFAGLIKHYKENHVYEGEFQCTICKGKTSTLYQAIKHYDDCFKAKLLRSSTTIRPPSTVSRSSFSSSYASPTYAYQFAPPSPSFNFNLNSTTINNSISHQHLPLRTANITIADHKQSPTASLLQNIADKVAKKSPTINLNEQSKQRFVPGGSKPGSNSKHNSGRVLRSDY